jgi:hypothetical protein
MKRGIRPVVVAECDRAVESGESNRWEPALDVLASCLKDASWHSAVCRLVVANHWACYAIVPWSDALIDQSERINHARYCLAKTYGDVVAQWTVTVNEGAPGEPQVACAIPSALIDGIQLVADTQGLRVISVQPQLIAAFNGWRGRLPKKDGWFFTLEEGSLAAAHFTANGWDRVRAVRIGDDWEVELKRLQTFGRLANASGEEGRVYVDAPHWFRDKAGVSQFEFEWLDDGSDVTANGGQYALLHRMYA